MQRLRTYIYEAVLVRFRSTYTHLIFSFCEISLCTANSAVDSCRLPTSLVSLSPVPSRHPYGPSCQSHAVLFSSYPIPPHSPQPQLPPLHVLSKVPPRIDAGTQQKNRQFTNTPLYPFIPPSSHTLFFIIPSTLASLRLSLSSSCSFLLTLLYFLFSFFPAPIFTDPLAAGHTVPLSAARTLSAEVGISRKLSAGISHHFLA